ncbi:MAG: peptide deformylase [Lachnospiraceae bacterium]|nr:peptide deformylase [Lachnospiraceae bacterium]
MSHRTIRVWQEDDILRKVSKPVKTMTPRIQSLIEDMYDTMYEADGVGLAAPQVGILRRLFVIDIRDGSGRHTFINPEILKREGSQTDSEGCLSVPGKHATVTRAMKVTVRALDGNFEPFTLEAEGFMARAIQHEYDHLDGILYVDKKEGELIDNEAEEEE